MVFSPSAAPDHDVTPGNSEPHEMLRNADAGNDSHHYNFETRRFEMRDTGEEVTNERFNDLAAQARRRALPIRGRTGGVGSQTPVGGTTLRAGVLLDTLVRTRGAARPGVLGAIGRQYAQPLDPALRPTRAPDGQDVRRQRAAATSTSQTGLAFAAGVDGKYLADAPA